MRIKHLFFKVTGKLMKKLVIDLQTDKLTVLCNSAKFLDYLKAIINKSFIIISCIVQFREIEPNCSKSLLYVINLCFK